MQIQPSRDTLSVAQRCATHRARTRDRPQQEVFVAPKIEFSGVPRNNPLSKDSLEAWPAPNPNREHEPDSPRLPRTPLARQSGDGDECDV